MKPKRRQTLLLLAILAAVFFLSAANAAMVGNSTFGRGGGPAPPPPPPSPGTIGYWKLDDGAGNIALDSSAYHKNAIVNGNPSWLLTGGRINGALELDGINDYLSAPFVLNPVAGPFSVLLWVKTKCPGKPIVSQTDGYGSGRIWLCTDTFHGKLMTSLTGGARFPIPLISSSVITDDKWHHIGLVWDGSRRYLYADGAQVAADADIAGPLYSANGELRFGAGQKLDANDFMPGLLDDIRICNRALSATEVSSLVAQTPHLSNDTVSSLLVAPNVLYVNTPATFSITALNIADHSAAQVPVTISLQTDPLNLLQLFEGNTDDCGKLAAQFDIPDVAPGTYTLEVKVGGVEYPITPNVQILRKPMLLIETDKPIYKPGQTIQGRVIVLTNQLRPSVSEVNVEITDGKGVKIFRKPLTTNSFGVAPFKLDLASELNFGTWKITVECGSASSNIDVRVEKYVLPRFEVKLDTSRDYFLVNEQITGSVNANYFFGKPVDGTVEIRASRYVGVWEIFATYNATLLNGKADFTLPAVGYVSGTSGASGAGSVQLEVTVTDTSNHEGKTIKLIKIVKSTIQNQLIPLTPSITPGRPFDVLVTAKTPDGQPLAARAEITAYYYDQYCSRISQETVQLPNVDGSAVASFNAPAKTAWAWLKSSASRNGVSTETELTICAAYSPTDSFLHLSRDSKAPINVGDIVTIDVFRTHHATIYYDVFANGHTVWSEATIGDQIRFQATHQMVPAARVVAYIINPNNEISADTLPLEVTIKNLGELKVQFNANQVLPGEPVRVSVSTKKEAMVGLSIVDESVYALNEGRLNMQEVFNELERRFMEPQSETHSYKHTYGAYDIFKETGFQILSSGSLIVPQGKPFYWPLPPPPPPSAGRGGSSPPPAPPEPNPPLVEVTRIRQFFPETWLWLPDLLTDSDGAAEVDLTAPDSITTWRLHAVSTSDDGLGIGESSLLVFQEFFGEPDLPYAVTRGEQFPVRIQIFNYLDVPQIVQVELTEADWFDLLEDNTQQVLVNGNSVALASFLIEPTKLGRNILEVTLRSTLRADAVRKELLVEPEGTQRELVTNGMLHAGQTVILDANVPKHCVAGSEKLLLSITPSLVAQSINGIDDLLQMPYGCGEQNMIFFAPDVEILRYLNATGQLTPEVRAKAEHFINVGYQRELTYRRQDGSFSAFGDSDKSGSLWLTAFVLGTFSAARDIQTVDETVLAGAAGWIESHQLANGSWEPVGFLHHKEMMGSVNGPFTLTAFVTIALADYGSAKPATLSAASTYLVNNLYSIRDNPYALAVAALAFARTGNITAADAAITRLLEMAITDVSGIHWEPCPIETTAYAALAMIEMQKPQASSAIKWLSLKQNSHGGFGSTQDTVMALKAIMTAARTQSRDARLTIDVTATDGSALAQFTVDSNNFDVLQIAELPAVSKIRLSATGSGETRFQLVRRYNVFLAREIVQKNMTLEVIYDANNVDVDDIVNVTAIVRYIGRAGESGMMIVDVGVPTGFEAVQQSLDAIVSAQIASKVELAGRKVIFYIDGLTGGEQRSLVFQVKARFPVRAVIPDSKAYLYYEPDIRAEAAGKQITVGSLGCKVDFNFLSKLSGQWLKSGTNLDADIDDNGSVNLRDFSLLANKWLDACP